MKHTKGNWEITDLEIIRPMGTNKSICQITGSFIDETESKANAKLIAAAPDLLGMLIVAQNMLNLYVPNTANDGSVNGEKLAKVEEAIKKATI